MNIPVLTTARLILRPLELADAAAIQKSFPRWEIVRFGSIGRIGPGYLGNEEARMRLVGTMEGHYVSGQHSTEIWEITRDEWRARYSTAKPLES